MYGQFSRFVGRLSLRRIIRIAFFFQILIPVSFLGWMFLGTSRESVEALSMRLGREVAARIAEHLESYMAVPLLVNSLNADALESGRVNIISPQIGGADVFLDCYAAKSKLLLYSNGLFAPKDIFILFSLYQYR